MLWPWSASKVDLSSLTGLEAVKYFNKAESAQRYRYLSNILGRKDTALYSPVTKDISLLDLPEPRVVSSPIFLGKKFYYYGRNNFVRQSLLTATLYVQRPLNEDEARAVTHWSAREYNSFAFSTAFLFVGFAIFGPWNAIRRGLTPLLKNLQVMQEDQLTNYTRKHFLQDPGGCRILLAGVTPFLAYRSVWRQEEMADTRLEAVRAAEAERNPKWWAVQERFDLWSYGWRSRMISQRAINLPSLQEMNYIDWRKLKYEASAFVDPPPGLANVTEEADG